MITHNFKHFLASNKKNTSSPPIGEHNHNRQNKRCMNNNTDKTYVYKNDTTTTTTNSATIKTSHSSAQYQSMFLVEHVDTIVAQHKVFCLQRHEITPFNQQRIHCLFDAIAQRLGFNLFLFILSYMFLF